MSSVLAFVSPHAVLEPGPVFGAVRSWLLTNAVAAQCHDLPPLSHKHAFAPGGSTESYAAVADVLQTCVCILRGPDAISRCTRANAFTVAVSIPYG